MKSIAFLSQKGGSGKTTLSIHTAVAAQEDGERVVLIDTDRQQSASVWGKARSDVMPVVATATTSDLEKVFDAAKNENMSIAIIDTAPHAAPDAIKIVQKVDFVIIPVRPTALDIGAANNAVDIVRAAHKKCGFLLSACPVRAPEIRETREVLKNYGIVIAPVEIIERRSFSRALATGRSVTEYEAESKAAQEIRDLWKWIKGELK